MAKQRVRGRSPMQLGQFALPFQKRMSHWVASWDDWRRGLHGPHARLSQSATHSLSSFHPYHQLRATATSASSTLVMLQPFQCLRMLLTVMFRFVLLLQCLPLLSFLLLLLIPGRLVHLLLLHFLHLPVACLKLPLVCF